MLLDSRASSEDERQSRKGENSTNYFAKEIATRKRIASIEEDFPSLREYNDYLVEVKDMTVNLLEGIDVPVIEANIARDQKENAEQIMNAQARKAEEYAAALAASKGQPDNDVRQSSQEGVGAGAQGYYAPSIAGGAIVQPRPTGMAPQPFPTGSDFDMQWHDLDDHDIVELRAETGGMAGGWSVELSKKRAL